MKIRQPKRERLIVEHGPWRTLLSVFAVIAGLIVYAFNQGLAAGLVVSLLGVGIAWQGARRLELTRVVFDADRRRVDIRRRTGQYGSGAASYALDEVGGVEAVTAGEGIYAKYQLVLVIPNGPHAGRHPLNQFEIPGHNGRDLAVSINSWLKHNQ